MSPVEMSQASASSQPSGGPPPPANPPLSSSSKPNPPPPSLSPPILQVPGSTVVTNVQFDSGVWKKFEKLFSTPENDVEILPTDDPDEGGMYKTGNESKSGLVGNDNGHVAAQQQETPAHNAEGEGGEGEKKSERTREVVQYHKAAISVGAGDRAPGDADAETTIRTGWFISEVRCYKSPSRGLVSLSSRAGARQDCYQVLRTCVKLDIVLKGSSVTPSISCLDISFGTTEGRYPPHFFFSEFDIQVTSQRGDFFPFRLSPVTWPTTGPKPIFDPNAKRSEETGVIGRVECTFQDSTHWRHQVRFDPLAHPKLSFEYAKPPDDEILPRVTYGPLDKTKRPPRFVTVTVGCVYDGKIPRGPCLTRRNPFRCRNKFIHRMEMQVDIDQSW